MRRPSDLSTADVVLRDVIEEDLPIFFEHQLEPEATRMAAFPSRNREAFMEHWRTKALGDETVVAKTVVVDGQVAGNVVSWQQSEEREVGYWIGREFWGRGVATKAVSAFLEHDRTRPLYAHVAEHNVASVRVLRKCGFAPSDEAASCERDDDVKEVVLKLDEDVPRFSSPPGAPLVPRGPFARPRVPPGRPRVPPESRPVLPARRPFERRPCPTAPPARRRPAST